MAETAIFGLIVLGIAWLAHQAKSLGRDLRIPAALVGLLLSFATDQ
jgi:hypothetical protein